MAKSRSADEANHGDRPSPKVVSKSKKVSSSVFVQFVLSDEQRGHLKSTALTSEQIDGTLSRLFDDGYKLSMKWDDYSKAFAAWLIAPEWDNPNMGRILSGRGSTPIKALKQLFYIHFNIAEDRVWASLEHEWVLEDD